MHQTHRSIYGFWTAAFEAQAAMWTTLAVRVPLLVTGTMTPAEQNRMVSEKFDAWSDSARDTSASVGRMMLNPLGVMKDPASLFGAMMSLSSTASKPYQDRLSSNARRLRKRL